MIYLYIFYHITRYYSRRISNFNTLFKCKEYSSITHVAGIAAGNGACSGGKYAGMAIESNIVSVKILDEKGQGNTVQALSGIQWVVDNKKKYNIRICNLSIGTPDFGSSDPLIKAVNAAWDAGIIVTVAAGNNGPAPRTITSPGVSRKAITVGVSDDETSVQILGDRLKNYSGRGPTMDCIIKPDVIAPGASITSCRTPTPYINIRSKYPLKLIDENYIQMSGTSMSTPIVSGAIALLLEKAPFLTPNEVKLLLKKSSTDMQYPKNKQGWGLININKLLRQVEINN